MMRLTARPPARPAAPLPDKALIKCPSVRTAVISKSTSSDNVSAPHNACTAYNLTGNTLRTRLYTGDSGIVGESELPYRLTVAANV
ncbi:hypothetical protein J6590_040759 [Homalodisca vitripennis]|nr:hypothetical protein J6590_040759 [Homalodisca vitripennis]